MNDTALLVIDMQQGLFKRQIYNQQQLIDNINHLLDIFHQANRPVVFFRHANESFLKSGSDDWQLHSALRRAETDIIIEKTHSSIFKEKVFTELLAGKNISSVVITGLVSNGCIQVACTGAVDIGLKTTLVSDGHSTWHKDAEKMVADYNAKLAAKGIQVLPAHEIRL
jgi:nicotinamidase-related amidase